PVLYSPTMQTTTRPARRPTTEMKETPPAPPTPIPAPGQRLYAAAASVGIAFVIGRILGLGRDILIARQFGTGPEIAAYYAAFRVPDFIFLMVMSGAFGSAFVPVFTGYLEHNQLRKAWRLASNVMTLMVEWYALAALVVFALADPLVRFIVAPDFAPETQDQTVVLTRILLLSPFFLGLGAASKSLLETHNRFTLPAYAPVVYNAAGVGGALFLAPRYGVKGLAWGIVLGSLLHVLLQLPGLVAIGMRYSFLPKPVADGVRQVGRLLVPRIVGQAAFQINFTLVLTTLASRLGETPTSALNYGYQLMMLPHGLLAISVSTVIFPLMARQYAQRQFESLKATFGDALRPLFFLTIPASAALAILARPIVQSIYQRGSFSAESTLLVADVLPYFAAGLVALALVETSARAFYAMHDTRTPLVASLATIAVNLILAVILLNRLGGRGLAAAMTVTTTLEMIVLLGALRRKIGPFDVAVWTAFIKSLLATIAMALVLLLIRPRLIAVTDPDGPATSAIGRLAIFGFALFIGLYTYLVAAWYLRTRELLELVERFGGRLTRLIRRR
ncbi:MAG: murein biosynthesis integral membrane protein MurJ, partial [Thermomicrobiales bacterium]